ncbi:MAG: CapA family protein [Deltaproteobacteria bacterium]|nr:CapA family protein [Deltaproteobacteria bacterium]
MLGREVGRRLDRYGYKKAFERVLSSLHQADLAIGNLEACFSGDETQTIEPLTFFAPNRQLIALLYLGFDVLNLANNHCSPFAVDYSQKLLNSVGILTIGSPVQGFDGLPIQINRNGLKVAIISGMLLPTTKQNIIKIMQPSFAKSLQKIAAVNDFVVATIHWGDEYANIPNTAQQQLAHWLVHNGVNFVIGHHPHVVQPVAEYKNGLIAYSLGNFIFDQEGYIKTTNGLTERGLMLRLRLHKKLGWSKQEIATCIVDRYQVDYCETQNKL